MISEIYGKKKIKKTLRLPESHVLNHCLSQIAFPQAEGSTNI